MIKIGSYTLGSNILLAPMSGCTDLPFRLIAREHGAKFAFFEMVDSHSVFYHRRRTLSILKTSPRDDPIALQLLGADPGIMLKAAREILATTRVAFLDINAACPAKKVIKKKAGAHLISQGDALCRIIDALVSSTGVPVTVKLRLAHLNETTGDIVSLARRCEDAGASALFVHGRTRLQYYAGDVDYGALRAIKAAVRVPVVGSGNILSPREAKTMFDMTGCDGILVARGSLGNPWIFGAVEAYLATGTYAAPPPLAVKKEVLKRHLAYVEELCGCPRETRIGIQRKVAIWYMKSFPRARRVREKIGIVNTYEKMLEFIDSIEDDEIAYRASDIQHENTA